MIDEQHNNTMSKAATVIQLKKNIVLTNCQRKMTSLEKRGSKVSIRDEMEVDWQADIVVANITALIHQRAN
jgi:hypothetical protein